MGTKLTKAPKEKVYPLNLVKTQKNLEEREDIIKDLLANNITIEKLDRLAEIAETEDLSDIIQHIYDLNEKYILELSTVDGILKKLNDVKNSQRNKAFFSKIKKNFRNQQHPERKIILAEGDSWFNYPVILTDIIDRVCMENDFAVYSLAAGGDWLLNMLSARQYVEELSLLHPDIFLISGGGNDLVGSHRLAAIVEPHKCQEYEKNPWARRLIKNANTEFIPFNANSFYRGVEHLSKDFFSLLMFFRLQYYILIKNLLLPNEGRPSKFAGMKIITQGYDCAIPSSAIPVKFRNWYITFIRKFLGHGSWLKTPLLMRGILDTGIQRDILYAMIYLFNEMMIEVGRMINKKLEKRCVFHIDCRNTVQEHEWVDELHTVPRISIRIAEKFIQCINDGGVSATYDSVYVVNPLKSSS